MTDGNNSKVLSQKICKCGVNVAKFLNDISILEENLRKAKVEESAVYIIKTAKAV